VSHSKVRTYSDVKNKVKRKLYGVTDGWRRSLLARNANKDTVTTMVGSRGVCVWRDSGRCD
jgi:hypothetical protein